MKTHELILAVVLALALGVLIELGGSLMSVLLAMTFGRGMFMFRHFWMVLHRPIQRLVFLLLPATGHPNPVEFIILYYLLCICAWGMLSFAGIWMFYSLHRESGDKN